MADKKRLIYADSGQESVEYLKRHLIVGDSDFLRGYLQGAEALADGLAKLPPVDAVEMVHGHWVSDKADILFHCSVCETQVSTDWDYDDLSWNYCPNCGAKMDQEAS